jgi:hypothetical protein
MTETKRMKYLSIALAVIGMTFIVGLYPLTRIWPSGWAWNEGQSVYLQMILGIYATLGVYLMLAAKNPKEYASIISFTIWSSIVHGAIMAVQAIVYPEHKGHLLGDVPALLVIAAVLLYLRPTKTYVTK